MQHLRAWQNSSPPSLPPLLSLCEMTYCWTLCHVVTRNLRPPYTPCILIQPLWKWIWWNAHVHRGRDDMHTNAFRENAPLYLVCTVKHVFGEVRSGGTDSNHFLSLILWSHSYLYPNPFHSTLSGSEKIFHFQSCYFSFFGYLYHVNYSRVPDYQVNGRNIK